MCQLPSVLIFKFFIWLSSLWALFSKHFKYEQTINITIHEENLTLMKHRFTKFNTLVSVVNHVS